MGLNDPVIIRFFRYIAKVVTRATWNILRLRKPVLTELLALPEYVVAHLLHCALLIAIP